MISSFGKRRLITAAVAAMVPYLLACCSCVHVVRANLFEIPTPKWSVQLQDSGPASGRGLRKGNAIVAAKDGTKIVVTANDGSLHIIQTTNQVKTLAVYTPERKPGTNMDCGSGAIIVYKNQQDGLSIPIDSEEDISIPAKEDFIVYAVIDNRGGATTSRVLAVNMEGILKWSVDVRGRIRGTPVVGNTGIYISHNINGYGTLSTLRIQQNDGTATVVAEVNTLVEGRGLPIPFGPPALQKPYYWEDESMSEDIVIVAESWEGGYSESRGGLYMLSTSSMSAPKGKEDAKDSTETAEYELVKISSWSFSASAPPLVYGESIFVGAAGGTIGGFTGDRKSDLSGILSGKEDEISPRWDYQVSPNPQFASQPIRNQPVLDSEGQYLFVSGVDSDLYCLQSDNGREIWRAEAEEGSQILVRPRVFEGENRKKVVYAIEAQNGRVRQYDLYSGLLYWDYSCTDIGNEVCLDTVEAEFEIAPSGNSVYYGDIYGRINSLEVANFETAAPTIGPSSPPTTDTTGKPTTSSAPTVAVIPTEVPQEASNATAPEEPTGSIIINGGDSEEQDQQDGGNNAEKSVTVDQQAIKGDSNKLAVYIGAAIAGLCILMIPLILLSMLRRRRKKSDVVVEIIDDCSSDPSDDIESQADLDYINSIETKNSCDPNNGDGIEIEIINHARGNPTKGSLPDTPDTVKSLDSIDEFPDDASANVVMGEEDDIADPSVKAVNLRQSFDRAVASLPLASGSTVIQQDSVAESFYFSDDDVPPPPPLEEEAPVSPTSNEMTWNTLLQVGTSQSSKELNSSSQISLKKPNESARAILPSQEEFSASMSIGGQKDIFTDEQAPVQKETIKPLKKFKWRKKKKNPPSSSPEPEKDSAENEQAESPTSMNEEDESQVSTKEELNGETAAEQASVNSNTSEETEEVAQTPASPSTYEMLTDAMQSLTSVRSGQSVAESLSTDTVGSDDESLYTSMGGTHEQTQVAKDLSPLSDYVYAQTVLRRTNSDIAKERKRFLAQPALSKSNAGFDEEHPDDEIALAPASQYLSEETNDHKYGKSVRSKRDSNPFESSNSNGNEGRHTPIALMYDQLAAIGQQRREEMKPAFKRRNKRLERENITPPPQQQEKQEGDNWGSFLNELAEAEKEFFTPSASSSKSLLNSIGSKDDELARTNDVDNH